MENMPLKIKACKMYRTLRKTKLGILKYHGVWNLFD